MFCRGRYRNSVDWLIDWLIDWSYQTTSQELFVVIRPHSCCSHAHTNWPSDKLSPFNNLASCRRYSLYNHCFGVFRRSKSDICSWRYVWCCSYGVDPVSQRIGDIDRTGWTAVSTPVAWQACRAYRDSMNLSGSLLVWVHFLSFL